MTPTLAFSTSSRRSTRTRSGSRSNSYNWTSRQSTTNFPRDSHSARRQQPSRMRFLAHRPSAFWRWCLRLDTPASSHRQGVNFGRRSGVTFQCRLTRILGGMSSSGCDAAIVVLGTGAHVRCHGKGRKVRCTPLHRGVVPILRSWLTDRGVDPALPMKT